MNTNDNVMKIIVNNCNKIAVIININNNNDPIDVSAEHVMIDLIVSYLFLIVPISSLINTSLPGSFTYTCMQINRSTYVLFVY